VVVIVVSVVVLVLAVTEVVVNITEVLLCPLRLSGYLPPLLSVICDMIVVAVTVVVVVPSSLWS
jgi:hypothetical protein